jgi:hypothetical protein
MNTTAGETCLKSSGIDLLQSGSAFNSGIPNPMLAMHRQMEHRRLLKFFIPRPP